MLNKTKLVEGLGIKIVVADGKFCSGRNRVLVGHVPQEKNVAFPKSQAAHIDRVPTAYMAVYLQLGDPTCNNREGLMLTKCPSTACGSMEKGGHALGT